jgi:hypothetical protein
LFWDATTKLNIERELATRQKRRMLVSSGYSKWLGVELSSQCMGIYWGSATPWFKKINQSHHMCAQEVHTYNKRIEISETMLYIAENIFIITVTNIGPNIVVMVLNL